MEATIYRIIGGEESYIGSTKRSLKSRKSDHLSNFKRGLNLCASYSLLQKHGIENCKFEELEKCPIEQRYLKEKEYIMNGGERVVNRIRPMVTLEEKTEDRKGYFQKFKGSDNYKATYLRKYTTYKDKLLAHTECSCGKSYALVHKQRHLRTAFHQRHTTL